LDVVAEGVGKYLFAPESTLSAVAKKLTCSWFTVRRWIVWMANITTVSALMWHVLDQSGEPVVPQVLPVSQPKRKASNVVLKGAAAVLCILEVLAVSAGLDLPGLSSVVEAVVANRYRVTTYAAPTIPEFARRQRLRFGSCL
jgi:hypothetical protein